jgi:hypothetical protein
MASEETTISNKQININDTVGIKLDANQAELYSTDGKIPIFAKCGDNEIKLIDENGNTYLKSLTVNGKNIENMSDELTKVLNIFKGAEWSKTFSVYRSSKGDNNTMIGDVQYFTFAPPFKGAKYTITCSEMTDSLTGNKDSPVASKRKNGVRIYKGKLFKTGLELIHIFTENGDFGPVTLDSDLLIGLDTQEEKTGDEFDKFGSHYAQAGSCKITLKLSIED